jgi:hypothetical protein
MNSGRHKSERQTQPTLRSRSRRFWRFLRLTFRGFRITVWLGVLLFLTALIYVSQIGLPGFAKQRILQELKANGISLEFERVRWRWHQGIVADEITLRSSQASNAPSIYLGEASVRLSQAALCRFQLKIEGLEIRRGRLEVPLSAESGAPLQLSITNISTVIRFLPGNQWELDEFQAQFEGARIQAQGSVANAIAIQSWGRPARKPTVGSVGELWRTQLYEIVKVARSLHFQAPPSLWVRFKGDAIDPASFTAELRCEASGATSPWGRADNLLLKTRLNDPPLTNGWFSTDVSLVMANAETRWGKVRTGHLKLLIGQSATNAIPRVVQGELRARELHTEKVSFLSASLQVRSHQTSDPTNSWRSSFELQADDLDCLGWHSRSNVLKAEITHSLTNRLTVAGEANLQFGEVQGPVGTLQGASIHLFLTPASSYTTNSSWGAWNLLAPHRIRLAAEIDRAVTRLFPLQSLSFTAGWELPNLTLTNLQARSNEGELRLPSLALDIDSRRLELALLASLDWHRLGPALPTNAAAWLADAQWSAPPGLQAEVAWTVPPWTNLVATSSSKLLETARGTAILTIPQPSLRGVTANSLSAKISYGDRIVKIPQLLLDRPEGRLEASGSLHLLDRDFSLALQSQIYPDCFYPIAGRGGQLGLGYFHFSEPPRLEAQIQGSLLDLRTLSVSGSLGITNFFFRKEAVETFRTDLALSNLFLVASQINLTRSDGEWVKAPAVGLNLTNGWLYFTNAEARVDPMRVCRAIGGEVPETIEPYHFSTPPLARVNGEVPTVGGTRYANMTFEVNGGPFNWWRFRFPQIEATVRWQGDTVTITNLVGGFYRGNLRGHMFVDFPPGLSPELRFETWIRDMDLHQFLADVTPSTNNIEGWVSGYLNITSAKTEDWDSWFGSGTAEMRDGLLWELPLFGLFSPALNSVTPGLGSSRAKAGRMTYTIKKSVVYTDDLEIRSPPAFLLYDGRVNFQGQLSARVEAKVLRTTPLLGPLLGLVTAPLTKLAEYKVTGTLGEPVLAPMYFPARIVEGILSPFRILKKLAPKEPPPSTADPGTKTTNGGE